MQNFINKVVSGNIKLIMDGSNSFKLSKNETKSYGLSLSPSNLNFTGKSVCPFASEGCIKACINFSGNGFYDSVQLGRRNRTEFYLTQPKLFCQILLNELNNLSKRAAKLNTIFAIRLNVFSDIDWVKEIKRYTNSNLLELENLQFYDYTKSKKKAIDYLTYSNYHITFSRSETNWKDCLEVLQHGVNVSVVFGSKILPKTFFGYPVIDGDSTDERFNDAKGVIVGLTAKGHLGKKDNTGFVYREVKQLSL